MVVQAMRIVGGVVPYVSLSVTPQSHSHPLTSIGTHPLQPGLSLFLSLCMLHGLVKVQYLSNIYGFNLKAII